jgi:hypothetical protein
MLTLTRGCPPWRAQLGTDGYPDRPPRRRRRQLGAAAGEFRALSAGAGPARYSLGGHLTGASAAEHGPTAPGKGTGGSLAWRTRSGSGFIERFSLPTIQQTTPDLDDEEAA